MALVRLAYHNRPPGVDHSKLEHNKLEHNKLEHNKLDRSKPRRNRRSIRPKGVPSRNSRTLNLSKSEQITFCPLLLRPRESVKRRRRSYSSTFRAPRAA